MEKLDCIENELIGERSHSGARDDADFTSANEAAAQSQIVRLRF